MSLTILLTQSNATRPTVRPMNKSYNYLNLRVRFRGEHISYLQRNLKKYIQMKDLHL
jgi:hypothetical protein